MQSENRFIRPKEVQSITGLSRTTIWRLEKDQGFPSRRQISRGAVGYLHSDILDWIESRHAINPLNQTGSADNENE